MANKWLKGLNTVEQVKEAIVLELGVWVEEQKPKTALEAGQLADDYSEAKKQTAKEN